MSKRFRNYDALGSSLQYKALRRCQRFKRLQGAVRSTLGSQSCSPWAGPRPGGPEHRARAAEQGQTGTQPALPPRPSRPALGRKGASRRSAGGAWVRLLRLSPGLPRLSLLSRPGRRLRNLHRPDALPWPPACLRRSWDHSSLCWTRLPERVVRPAARRAARAGPALKRGRPLLRSTRGGAPSKTELLCWSVSLEAEPFALRISSISRKVDGRSHTR